MTSPPSIVECACGVCYERREVAIPIKDIGLFECIECGARLEIWSGRSVPVFTRIANSAAALRSA